MLQRFTQKYKCKCNNCGFGELFFNNYYLTNDSGTHPLVIISFGKKIMF